MTDFCHASLAYTLHNAPDMTVRQIALLGLVCDFPGMSVAPLAEAMRVSKPVITRARHTLEQLGLVTASPCELDARKIAIVPTAEGTNMRGRLGAMG